MDIVLPVMGGLGLFLYGMNLMGAGLQKVAGNRLKRLIEILTNNRILGVLIGTLVTMIIQSSSATTVMVIGFVNAGLMSLTQAVGVIMGANIGTTVTAQIIAFKVTDYAPIAVAIGVAMWLIASKKKFKDLAEILIGFGILFVGMDMMSSGLKPLAELEAFSNILISLENSALGMLVGVGLTTLLQSSSASTGLLQALAMEGLIDIKLTLPMLFGGNIGTTTTAMISSIGANRTAKRAAVIHFLFNVVGTILFMTLFKTPIENLVLRLSPGDVTRQIANAHTLFNVASVILMLPFAGLLVKAAQFLVPGDDVLEITASKYLDARIIETPSIALGQARKEVFHMGELALENLTAVESAFLAEKYEDTDHIFEREQTINKIEREITDYLLTLSHADLSDSEHEEITALINIINDIERVGDHIENLAEETDYKYENNIQFSEKAENEMREMFSKCKQVFEKAMFAFRDTDEQMAREAIVLEDEVDALEKLHRKNHIDRLNKGYCESAPGVLFLDSLSNLERVGDHSFNISMYILDKFKEK